MIMQNNLTLSINMELTNSLHHNSSLPVSGKVAEVFKAEDK
jgi:hypothetical protein